MIPLMKYAFLNEFETKKALAEFIMTAPRLSMGAKCREFEKEFAKIQGRKHAVLFNSGGSANLAILQTLKNLNYLKNGDKVGFSALTWSTNTMPIIQLGLEPVPIDCDPGVLNVMLPDLKKIADKVRIKAFFVTNALGLAGNLAEIKKYCCENEIIFIEDNCEALGTELHEGRTGNFGLASSFSFFVAHHMSTIEGGMICTDDDDFAEMNRIVRANGWDRNLDSSQQIKWRQKYDIKSEFNAKYTFYDLGYNFRPTEITGFLGLFQLKFLSENIKIRENNYLILEPYIKDNEELISLNRSHIKVLSSFALPVVCKDSKTMEKYTDQFSGAGVEIRPMIAGNMQKQPFYSKYVSSKYDLPGTDFIHQCSFYCGNYPGLSEEDIQTLCSCLTKY
jgi:CDP-6-deoxy-D-xylo-4-hexulose-3-dehydrase